MCIATANMEIANRLRPPLFQNQLSSAEIPYGSPPRSAPEYKIIYFIILLLRLIFLNAVHVYQIK